MKRFLILPLLSLLAACATAAPSGRNPHPSTPQEWASLTSAREQAMFSAEVAYRGAALASLAVKGERAEELYGFEERAEGAMLMLRRANESGTDDEFTAALLFANTATLDLLDLATGGLDETTDAHSGH